MRRFPAVPLRRALLSPRNLYFIEKAGYYMEDVIDIGAVLREENLSVNRALKLIFTESRTVLNLMINFK